MIVLTLALGLNLETGLQGPYYAMYGRNPRVSLDLFFPDNYMQGVLKWTNFVLNLSKHIEDIHEEMM